MAKITKIDVSEYQGKKSYKFTLDNGQTGYSASDSDRKPWEYKEGESVTVTKTEVKKGKKGDYNNFTFKVGESTAQGTQPPQNAPEVPRTPNIPHAKVDIAEWKFKSRMQLCDLTHQLLLNGKFSDIEARQHVKDWAVLMDELIDGIFTA